MGRDPVIDAAGPTARRRAIAIAIAIAVVAVGAALWWGTTASSDGSDRGGRSLFTPEERAPEGVRIRVEILNATATPRLAQGATRLLRDRGFDVVATGNTQARATTLVLDRTGHPEWARLVASVLGRGEAVEARPDTSRYVDVSVLLGADWMPPAKTFNP